MALVDGNTKLKRASENTDKTNQYIDDMISKLEDAERNAGSKLTNQVAARVRSMLATNFRRSGVQVRSGRLAEALAQVTVKVNLGRNARIVISMPTNEEPYENGSNFYKAAASVNFGSVRGLTDKNKRRRKTFKNQAQKRAKFDKDPSKKSQKTLGTVVTRPFGYWELTAAQQRELASMVGREFFNEITGSLSSLTLG